PLSALVPCASTVPWLTSGVFTVLLVTVSVPSEALVNVAVPPRVRLLSVSPPPETVNGWFTVELPPLMVKAPPVAAIGSDRARPRIVSVPVMCVTVIPATLMTASSVAVGRWFVIVVASSQLLGLLQSPEPPIQLTVERRVRSSRDSTQGRKVLTLRR